ncbi:MAG: hypothetical protein WCP74_09415 [Sphingobacteriia bacterium]|jgi:hypothetical protein
MKKVIIAAVALILSFNSFANASVKREEKNSEKVYYKQGEIIGTSTYFDFDKLPKDAIYLITTKFTFPTYSLKECIEFTDAYGDKNYFVSMNSAKDQLVLNISNDGEVSIASRIKK